MSHTPGQAPLESKDVANALTGPSISDAEPIQTNESGHGNELEPGADVKTPQEGIFFTIPTEIRLRIYELLLVSKPLDEEVSLWEYRDQPRSNPGILRTCKQIYDEANAILYLRNKLVVTNPESMFYLMDQIGTRNLKLVRSLNILVPWTERVDQWTILFQTLAEDASGLRDIEIAWGMDCIESLTELARGTSLGDDLDFVRALAQIKGLERLVIGGYYAKRWPAYLEEKMNVKVQEKLRQKEPAGDHDDGSDHEENIDVVLDFGMTSSRVAMTCTKTPVEATVEELRDYQRGTDNLRP
ncbi:Fc.00g108950.m01.CDS01 [Cosmosporella sp. VM-42]